MAAKGEDPTRSFSSAAKKLAGRAGFARRPAFVSKRSTDNGQRAGGAGEGMTHEAYFRAEGGAFYANPISAGPWRADSLMGRTVSGLLGFVIEQRHLEPGWVPARFTAELYELVD